MMGRCIGPASAHNIVYVYWDTSHPRGTFLRHVFITPAARDSYIVSLYEIMVESPVVIESVTKLLLVTVFRLSHNWTLPPRDITQNYYLFYVLKTHFRAPEWLDIWGEPNTWRWGPCALRASEQGTTSAQFVFYYSSVVAKYGLQRGKFLGDLPFFLWPRTHGPEQIQIIVFVPNLMMGACWKRGLPRPLPSYPPPPHRTISIPELVFSMSIPS